MPVVLLFLIGFALRGQAPDIAQGTLPQRWLSQGKRCMEIPEWQVHEYNPNLFLLRQSPCTDYEKPFLFLIFGKQRALLLDTGSRNGNLAPTLQRTVKQWLARNQRSSIPLLVLHTHEHGDHTAGDAALQQLQDPAMPISFTQAQVEASKALFGITNWPEQMAMLDLGERTLDVIPIPGHSPASIAFYDRQTAILFTGDWLYPGRLYVSDFPAFRASVGRLVQFTADKPVAHILGNHIEQSSTPFVDYRVGTIFQPDEHELALSRGSLLELAAALDALQGTPRRVRLRDFTIWPSGRQFSNAEEAAANRAYGEEQKRKMWNPE